MKVVFDMVLSVLLLILFFPFLILLFIIASIDTQSNGIFFQKRVGQFGRTFTIYKFKTLRSPEKKCSKIGFILRKYKLDELPQLINIVKGDMSFVGPRPDVLGYYDKLIGDDRKVLQLKPGLTSEASIKYSNEEEILNAQKDPIFYNDNVIFPDKIKMNIHYLENMSFCLDINILAKTILKVFKN